MSFDSILSANDLVRLLNQPSSPLIIACHHDLKDPDAGRQKWQSRRIGDAHFLHLDEDLSGDIIPGQTGRHPLPEKKAFLAKVKRLGYRDTSQQVVVYDSKGGGIAARAWWLFKWIGHHKVAVLDGGLPAFDNYLATSLAKKHTDEIKRTATAIGEEGVRSLGAQNSLSPGSQIFTLADVTSIEYSTAHLIVDSRTAPRYRGEEEPIDPVAGHIPSAINLPWPENLNAAGHFKSKEELKKRFAPLRDEASKNVFYCGSGVTACHNILAYYHAFGKMPSLYPGSWSEYLLTIQ